MIPMNSQIIPLLGITSPSFAPELLRTITVNATFEGEQTSVYKEAVLLDSASTRETLVHFPLRDGEQSSRTFSASAIDDPDKNRVIMLYGSSPEDQAVVSKSLKITSDLNIMLDLSENGGGIVDYPLLTGIGKLSGFFDLSSLPDELDYSQITIIANYRDPLEGTYNGLQAGKTTCESDGSWAIEGLNEAHKYNVVMSIPTFNDITYSNKETSDSTYIPVGDPYWKNVVTLLHFDDGLHDETGKVFSEGLNTTGRKLVANGTAFIDCIHDDFILGNSNFTIESLLMVTDTPNSSDGFGYIINKSPNSPDSNYVLCVTYISGVYRFIFKGSGLLDSGISTNEIQPNIEYHVAIVRNGAVISLYLNGVFQQSMDVGMNTLPNTSGPLRIGTFGYSSYTHGFRGTIDELRITKDVARYTENFTPPDKPFPNHSPK